MADKIDFELVMPDRLLIVASVEAINLPGVEGDFGVLPGHAPLISALRAGILELEGAIDVPNRIFIDTGFVEVVSDKVVVLVEEAIPVEELDRETIEKRKIETMNELEGDKGPEKKRQAEAKLALLDGMLNSAR